MQEPLVEESRTSAQSAVAAPLEWNALSFAAGDTEILRDLSGCFKPGELTCIIGPSGAGKSTLLNLLAGRQSTNGVYRQTGEILYDGVAVDPLVFRHQVAFVMQEETLMPTETPLESLAFSARLRRRIGHAEALEQAHEILQELGLTSCANTLIGSNLVKGISGGEKKRTAVGIELITQPKVFLLDEPTSGLDSYAAYELIKMLKMIASRGNLVCLTIHQPSSEIFEYFDQVICLRKGRTFFQGPPSAITGHFAKVGLVCPPAYNPADFLLFKAQTLEEAVALELSESLELARPRTVSHTELVMPAHTRLPRARTLEVSMLLRREFRSIARNKALLGSRIGMNLGQAIIFSIIYWNVNADLSNTFASLAGLGIAVMMGASQPLIITFPQERPIFLREYVSDMYSVISYFVAKSIAEACLALVITMVMFGIAWPCMGLHGNYFLFVLAAWLLSMSSGSVALFLGCTVSTAQKALALAPAIFVPQILFSGLFLPSSQVPALLWWVQYICPLKYAINLFACIEFGSYAAGSPKHAAGQMILDHMNIYESSAFVYGAILLAITVGFRILSMASLRRKARYVF